MVWVPLLGWYYGYKRRAVLYLLSPCDVNLGYSEVCGRFNGIFHLHLSSADGSRVRFEVPLTSCNELQGAGKSCRENAQTRTYSCA